MHALFCINDNFGYLYYYLCCTRYLMIDGKRKELKNQDQALHEATHGQFGEEPRPEPPIPPIHDEISENNLQQDRIRAAYKRSRSI